MEETKIPAIDPTGHVVRSWVLENQPAISELLDAVQKPHGSVRVQEYQPASDDWSHLATRCAVGIVSRRLAAYPRQFLAWWSCAVEDRPLADTLDAGSITVMRTSLEVNFGTPSDPGPIEHTIGAVAECFWHELTTAGDDQDGLPVLVEGHQWSVTDPGGDGLAVYRGADGLTFRLWETKASSNGGDLQQTINGAGRQLRTRALEYLGRYSTVAQRVSEDPDLAEHLCKLSELWVNSSPGAGAGVAVTAGSHASSAECFASLPNYFSFPSDRYAGMLGTISRFPEFATAVRLQIWQGAGLCSAP